LELAFVPITVLAFAALGCSSIEGQPGLFCAIPTSSYTHILLI
jgi:hypothetical protein